MLASFNCLIIIFRCEYPFCRRYGHMSTVCPILYGKCAKCQLRGHAEKHHAR